jgi:hypothetical protein
MHAGKNMGIMTTLKETYCRKAQPPGWTPAHARPARHPRAPSGAGAICGPPLIMGMGGDRNQWHG